MKIGILTFHRSQNYGALLQAKALQEYVRSLGHDVSFIDYWPAYHEEMYKPFSWQKFKAFGVKRKIRYLIDLFFIYFRLSLRRKKTRLYINNNLSITKDKKYDVVIYGSDQIWRKQHQPTYYYFNPVYFGDDYVSTKSKIAYAASMGKIEIDDEKDREFIKTHIRNFDAISIREKDLIDRLQLEYGISYQQVCDPVFLLTRTQWQSFTDSKYLPKEKYILYYRLQALKETDKMVNELVRRTRLRVIEMRSYMPYFKYGKRYRMTADAQEFITLINGAEYVVTSAFHGIAMSIIFQKQFFFTSEKNQANRVASLLDVLGLNDKFIDISNPVVDYDQRIDYTKVESRLETFSNESRNWLRTQLQNAENNN